MPERQHGDRAKYVKEGCRCGDCTAANRDSENHRARQIAYGRWEPYVDAEPARQHARALIAAGVPRRTLAELPGVGRGSLEKLLYGSPSAGTAPSRGIRAEQAEAILAVPMPLHAEGGRAKTDATGTRRRVQALIAAGWPLRQLAQHSGVHPANFRTTVLGDSPYVTTATERMVRRLYDELWRTEPLAAGVQRKSVERSLAWASREGWAPVGAWDEDLLDDPAALPDWTGLCGSLEGWLAHREASVPVCVRCAPFASKTRPARVLKPCGTLAAYRRHLRRGETPCAECTAANRDDLRARAAAAAA